MPFRRSLTAMASLAFALGAAAQTAPPSSAPKPSAPPPAPTTAPPTEGVDVPPKIVVRPAQGAGPFKVSRRALAKAYIELERIVAADAATTSPEVIRAVNQGFDSATDSFFVGDYSTAVKIIHDQIRRLSIGRIGPALDHYDFALDRAYIPVGVVTDVNVRVASMYASELKPEPRESIFGANCAQSGGQTPLRLPDADGSVSQAVMPIRPKSAGECVLSFGPYGAAAPVGATIRATPVPLDRMRVNYLRRVNAIPNADEQLQPAVRACRARIELLSDAPDESNSARFMQRLDELSAAIPAELDALEHEHDPYVRRTGDLWATIDVGGAPVPVRIYVPDRPPIDPGGARPLVIALHGAGGDENLWPDGYGGGVMRTISQREGFILLSPQVPITAAFEGFFDALVAGAERWLEIDKTRIYVIGHSMGGGVAAAWAKSRADRIAAVCTIAGIGQFRGATRLPPTLVIAGELDPLITPDRAKRDAETARAGGLPVEYREIKDYGHTLVVARAASDVVDWFLKQRLPAAPKPADKPGAEGPTTPPPAASEPAKP